jgi:hypothetical protein
MGVDLDTSLLNSWVEFKWIPSSIIKDKINSESLWKINFQPLHMKSLNIEDSYIPISFGITNQNEDFIGKLVSNINMFELTKYLRHILNDEQVHIIILNKEKNIIAQSTNLGPSVPRNFFQNYNFEKNNDTFANEYEFNNVLYSTYKNLKSYPFTIVVGENRNAIFKPLFKILINYFAVLAIVLIVFLTILRKFYKKIINPIISLSDFAKKILGSDEEIGHIAEKHSFVEITNLAEALTKINCYQKEICDSNKKLNQKTQELELIKQNLEDNLQKLSNSYALIDKMNKAIPTKNIILANQCIKDCLSMLYPEIYSRQLKIENSLKEDSMIELQISHDQFIKIISALLSRSFMFSKKSSSIQIKTGNTILENKNYFCFSLEDHGVGDKNWRIKNSDNEKMDEIKILIKNSESLFSCINKDEGVKYCLLLIQIQQTTNNSDNKNNIHYLFP